jgi:putative membrane protein
MFYHGFAFWGMDMIWWIVWILLMFWIFATPYKIPGQRYRPDTPLDVLQKLFASGEITTEEYNERKKILRNDFAR